MFRDHGGLAPSDRSQDKPVDAPSEEGVDEGLFPFRIVVQACREDGYSAGSQGIFMSMWGALPPNLTARSGFGRCALPASRYPLPDSR